MRFLIYVAGLALLAAGLAGASLAQDSIRVGATRGADDLTGGGFWLDDFSALRTKSVEPRHR